MRRGPTARAARRGRASAVAWAGLVGLFLLAFAALRVLQLVGRDRGPRPERPDPPDGPGAVGTFEARLEWRGARIAARLAPLHAQADLEGFRAGTLAERFGLEPGQPWRLELWLEAALPEPVSVPELRVEDARGVALVPLATLVEPRADPLLALYGAWPGPLEVERHRPLLLWGRTPRADGAWLVLAGEQGASAELRPVEGAAGLARWFAGDGRGVESAPARQDEIAALRSELERERARRAERELEFFEFTRLLAKLPVEVPAAFAVDPALAPPNGADRPASEAGPEAPEDPARERASELALALTTLMRLEGLRGLDLLDAGTLRDGALGPVIFRVLDGRGSLAGSVHAERLRLEASRSAHTLTLVLEDGYESRAGERVPFAGGARRIELSQVDPEPWLTSCPELFSSEDLENLADDGLWHLAQVKRELNRRLAEDGSRGWLRLHSFAGVRGGELRDVQLEEFDSSGRMLRRIFADRMELLLEDGNVVLQLLDGAFVRGEEKQPFRDGRHRIVLAGAFERWRGAPLPGLGQPPEREAVARPASPPGSGG
jgi:hypothetical protein